MQSSTGQYSTHAGEPAQPVQHSVITASSFGFFLRAVMMPLEQGSCFCSSGTIPGAFVTSRSAAISLSYPSSRSVCHTSFYHTCTEQDSCSVPAGIRTFRRLGPTSSHARARETLPDVCAVVVISRGRVHEFVIHLGGNVEEFVHPAIREF